MRITRSVTVRIVTVIVIVAAILTVRLEPEPEPEPEPRLGPDLFMSPAQTVLKIATVTVAMTTCKFAIVLMAYRRLRLRQRSLWRK